MSSAVPTSLTAGYRLREEVARSAPLQVLGVINAYCAILAQKAGARALYLSGAGVANASLGVPDLGISTLADVLIDVNRITARTELPLLVDADTGWGSAWNIQRCVKELIRAGAAGMHIEDQVQAKRCGHRPGKKLVSCAEMSDRIKAAVDARSDGFVIMARTDALASEGMEAAMERAHAYVQSGADMIFPEAMQTLEQYKTFVEAVPVPVLANITEFGLTPLFSAEQLAQQGVKLALYPLSGFRAMSRSCEQVFKSIIKSGSQQSVLERMQTREQLYQTLDYHRFEDQLNAMLDHEYTS